MSSMEPRINVVGAVILMGLVAYLIGVATATIFFATHPGLFR